MTITGQQNDKVCRTFDYIVFDESRTNKIKAFKAKFEELEQFAIDQLISGRAKSLVGTKLEEAYMWVGKALRDEQIVLGQAADIAERTNM